MCEEMSNLEDEHQCTIMHKNMRQQITYHFTLVVDNVQNQNGEGRY